MQINSSSVADVTGPSGTRSPIDRARRKAKEAPLPPEEAISDVDDVEASMAERLDASHYPDDVLRLLFICCHPDLAARAWVHLAEHRENDALMLMREAATREDATEKASVTPGPLAPARELLGDMLMELNRPDEARAEYRATLQKEPNRRRALQHSGSPTR